MPLVHITIADGRTPEQKKALLSAVTQAVQDTIDAPLDSIRVWITEMSGDHYMAAGELLADKRARAGS